MTGSEYDDGHHYVWDNQVRFAETDAQAVVFYGEYVTYQDETFTEYLRQIGYPLYEAAWNVHVVHVDLDYRAPAEFDDWLTNGIRAERIGESAIDFSYICRKRETGQILTEGGLTHVAVDADGEPTRVPNELRKAISDFQDEPPDGAE